MATKKQDAKREDPSFESAIGRLESIVEEMESDKLPLEDLLARYEEGVGLVKLCSEKLQAAEKRIEIITRDSGGRPKIAPFEAEEATSVPAAESGEVKLF